MIDEKRIDRSGFAIVSYQLEGLCTALRAVVPVGLTPGIATIRILKKLHCDVKSMISGKSLENLPVLEDDLTSVDVLAFAETLRAKMLAFMSPDDFDEQRRAFGFATSENHS